MGIFSGLAGIGLDSYTDKQIYETNQEKKQASKAKEVKEPLREESYLFKKTYTCPVCDTEFKALAVRAGKTRLLGQDDDLRPRYEGVDPLKYDAILCNHCGFAAISRGFTSLTSLQRKNIREQIGKNYKPIQDDSTFYSYDDAILRHKVALICSIVKNAKSSERAYTCLKLAWLTKSKMETMKADSPEYEKIVSTLQECYQNAYDGFEMAYSQEAFPMMGMDGMTVSYLMAVLATRLEKYDDAMRLVGRIITDHTVNSRLKERAVDLKQQIKEAATHS